MKLVPRVSLVLVGTMTLLLLLRAGVRVRVDKALYEKDIRRDHAVSAHVLRTSVAEVWEGQGEARAKHLVDTANRGGEPFRLRWIPVDARDVDVSRSDLVEVAEGRDIQRIVPGNPSEELVSYFAVRPGSPERGILELRESLAERDAHDRESLRTSLGFVATLAVAYLVLAIVLGRRLVGRHVDALVHKSRRVGEGDLSTPLVLDGPEEFCTLARELNGMCERLSAEQRRAASEAEARSRAIDQMRHADRLATVGKLAAGLAHEIGTPLSVVAGHAQMISGREVLGEKVIESAQIIDEQVNRVTRIVRQLLDFARREGPGGGSADVAAVATHVAEMLSPSARTGGVTIRVLGQAPRARVDEERLLQVLTNLLVNAVHASPEGGDVTVNVERVLATPPDGRTASAFVRIEVRDTGTGIPEDVLPNIFEPYFTTKATGEGTGLGLSVVHGIVHDYAGWIAVDSAPGRGTMFSVFFPVEEASS